MEKQDEGNVQDTPEVDPVVEGGDIEGAPDTLEGGPEGEPTETAFTPKHKTWEETEKARTTLEKDFHTAKTEAAQAKKELETHRQLLKSMKGEKEPDKPKADTPRARILREVNAKIKQIDQQLANGEINQEQHTEMVMDAWAEANEKLADARVQVRLSEHDQTSQRKSWLEKQVKDAGLSLMITGEDGTEIDAGVEAMFALGNSPNIPRGVSFEEEVEWAKGQLKLYNDALIEKFKTEQTGGRFPKPLGKGGKIPKGKEEGEGPSTLGDDFKELQESRRIKNI